MRVGENYDPLDKDKRYYTSDAYIHISIVGRSIIDYIVHYPIGLKVVPFCVRG